MIRTHRVRILHSGTHQHGQSFVEMAIILPILLLVLLGVVEVALYIARYMDILDLTREAARFASVRDPFEIRPADASNPLWDQDCSTPGRFDFYYDTACLFSPPAGSPTCTSSTFCNGFNRFAPLNPATDDILISVYTVTNNQVSNVWPSTGYWVFSDHDDDVAHNGNWAKDCNGNPSGAGPYYSVDRVNAHLSQTSGALPNKGFVAVEYFYCHEQALSLPMFTLFVSNPVKIHAYSLMPLPAAQPTATPIP